MERSFSHLLPSTVLCWEMIFFFLIAMRTNSPTSKGCCEAMESNTCRDILASWRKVLSESKPVKRRIAITFSDSEKQFCCKIVSKGKNVLDISCQI